MLLTLSSSESVVALTVVIWLLSAMIVIASASPATAIFIAQQEGVTDYYRRFVLFCLLFLVREEQADKLN
ncbi:hypothetical protein L195_g058986 [Trifolium pratense]|uniref:Uncharacterized protein n=1 Tax=Trifolium pratense TaxID=57577 RepID=A0A2K3JVF3_TRIPR|nr:hypothetical protein L195_g058986 [Trifolium pratense]